MSAAPVATGSITLDRDKAKEKLRRFQLADPCAWLLELVRAALVQGAHKVDVHTDADDVRVTFDGEGFALADFHDLYETLLSRSAPAARQHLAVALNGALALQPRFIEVTSRQGRGAGARLRLQPGKPDVLEVVEGDGPSRRTTVWLRHPFRVGAFVEFFRARLGTQRELAALRRGCRFSTIPVAINHRTLVWVPPTREAMPISSRGPAGSVVCRDRSPDAERCGVLAFTYHGVVLEDVPHPLLAPGLCALLRADHLKRDASLGALVRDGAWHELVDAALVAGLELSEQGGAERLERAAHALGPVVLSSSGDDTLADLPALKAALGRRSRPLFRQPVLKAVDGSDLTLADLLPVLAGGQGVALSSRPSKVPRRGEPILLARDEDDWARVTHFIGTRHRSAAELLSEAERRHHGLTRLRERAAAVALAPGEVLGRARWSRPNAKAQGVVGLRPAGVRLRLVLFTDGFLIGSHDLDCPLPGLTMAIEAPFTLQPDATDVVRDGVFTRALRNAFAAVPLAVADACKANASHRALPDRVLPFLAWLLDAEALWGRLAASSGCAAVDDLPPLPALILDGKRRHPVLDVPCLPRVDGGRSSLEAIRHRDVVVVPADTEQFSNGSAIKSGEVLRAVMGRVCRLDVQDEQARREARRYRLLLEPRTFRDPYPPAVPFRIGDAVKGWVCFGGQRLGVAVEAFVDGRALPVVQLDDGRLGSLRVVVDDPHLLPLADGKLALADARRLARAGLLAAGGLLETAAGGPGASVPGRRLTLALLSVLAPSEALARAAELLDADEYLALRALTLATESRDVDAVIELAMEAGNQPTVAVVRALAEAAGTALPKRGVTDRDAKALVLAPLGGLQALKDMDAALSLSARVLRRLPLLTTLELRTLDGTVTLQHVLEGSRPVRYVGQGFAVPHGVRTHGTVLVLSEDERIALRVLVGPSMLCDATLELKEAAARREHDQKPVEEARLDPGFHLGIVPVATGQAHGEVGLLPPTSSRPSATVRLLSGGRLVRRIDLSGSVPCSFGAVIDDPTLPLLLDRPEAARQAGVLAAQCIAAAEQALDQLVAKLAVERPDARTRSCVLERLSLHGAHPVEPQRLERLSQAPLIDTIHGRWVSFDQILAEVQRHRTVAAVTSAPRGTPPRELVLVMPVTLHRELLTRAGAPVEDVTQRWQKDTERQAALGAYPPLPQPAADAYATAEGSVAGVRATLWIAPGTRGEVVSVGLDERQLGTVPLETVLPRVAGVVSGEAAVDTTFTFVNLARAWPAIDVAAAALAARMVDLVEQPGTADEIREWCRKLAVALAAAPDAHGKRLGPLLRRLRALPLFPAPDGGRLSLDQVLATRPEVWEDELLAAGLVSGPAIAPPPPPVAPPPTPEEVLQGRLLELLALLALDDEASAQLASTPLLVVRRKGKALARLTRLHLELDVEHELGKAALEGDDAALDLVAAVLVGALNHHLDELDATHERAFLSRLLAHAATRGP